MSEAAPGRPSKNGEDEGQQERSTRASSARRRTNSSTSASTAAAAAAPRPLLSTDAVCHQLRTEFENMRRALTCSICLSTFRDAVVLSNCVHAYCRGCIAESIQQQQQQQQQQFRNSNHNQQQQQTPTCPLCHAPCGRRSITAQPELNRHVALYKAAVRRFGLAPVRYAPHIAMTQQAPASESSQQDDNDNEDEDDDGCHDEWLAARTFARALRRSSRAQDPGGAALLEEQEQVVAVNAAQQAAAAASAGNRTGGRRNTMHSNNSKLPLVVANNNDATTTTTTPAVAAPPNSNSNDNETPGIPTYTQIQAEALSQHEHDRSLLPESDDEFYSTCEHQMPSQLTSTATTAAGGGENNVINNNSNNDSQGAAGSMENREEEDDDDDDDVFDDNSTKIAARRRSFEGSDEDENDDGETSNQDDDETKIAARRSKYARRGPRRPRTTSSTLGRVDGSSDSEISDDDGDEEETKVAARRRRSSAAARCSLYDGASSDDEASSLTLVTRRQSPPAGGASLRSPNLQQQPTPPHPFSANSCSSIEHCASQQELDDDKTPQVHNHHRVRAMVAALEPRIGSNNDDDNSPAAATRSTMSSTSTTIVLPVRARVAVLEGHSRPSRRSEATRTSPPISTGSRSSDEDEGDDDEPGEDTSVASSPREKEPPRKQSAANRSGGSFRSSESNMASVIGAAGTATNDVGSAATTNAGDNERSVAEEGSPTGRNLSVRDRVAIFERAAAVATVATPASSNDRMQEDADDDDEVSLMMEGAKSTTTGVAGEDITAAVAATSHPTRDDDGVNDEPMTDNDDDDDDKPSEEEDRKPAALAQTLELQDHLGEQKQSDSETNASGNSTAEQLSNQRNSRLHVDTGINGADDDDSNRDGMDTDHENFTTPTAGCGLAVGNVVDVQSRTWPGVNQPGGVAKIIKVHTESDGSIQYDVQYVLDRRKEKKVDAVFVSLQEEIDSATKEESVGRRPRSTRHAEEKATAAATETANDEIPAELRAQLKREGFDVEGKTSLVVAAAASYASSMIPAKESKENSRLSLNADRPQDRNPAAQKDRIERKTKAMAGKGGKRKSSGASVCTTTTLVATKRKKLSLDEPKPALPKCLPHWSEGVQCKKADDFYRRNINTAIKKGVVSVCTSFLSEPEENDLKELCRHVKTLTSVRITVSESIQPSKTTICVLPAGIPSGCNLTAERRSLKAMQASVLGIPIVSPSWIAFCLERKKVVIPEANMYVRTLPTKTAIAKPFSADFGVSFLAAAKEYSESYSSSYSPFRNCSVYLLGFPSKTGSGFGSLLREAGAEVITHKQSALAKLKALNAEADDDSAKKIVIVVDANVSITDALEREVSNHSDSVAVVSSSWLVDSISCGVAVNPCALSYEPQGVKAKDLWKLTRNTVLS